MVAVYVAGGVSGAHINPAVTLALAIKRGFPWSKVGPYIVAQIAGAFLGALAVFLVYMEGLQEAGMPNVWSTGPGAVFGQSFMPESGVANAGTYSLLNASIAEFFGTMILILGVLAVGDDKNLAPRGNIGPLIVGFVVLAVGLSLGGPSGYSINPARDLGPRLLGLIVGTDGLFDGLYWLVPPVLIPALAGLITPFIYDALIAPYLPKPEPVGRTQTTPAD
jgi:glycerol uptake facilitator protein